MLWVLKRGGSGDARELILLGKARVVRAGVAGA